MANIIFFYLYYLICSQCQSFLEPFRAGCKDDKAETLRIQQTSLESPPIGGDAAMCIQLCSLESLWISYFLYNMVWITLFSNLKMFLESVICTGQITHSFHWHSKNLLICLWPGFGPFLKQISFLCTVLLTSLFVHIGTEYRINRSYAEYWKCKSCSLSPSF